MTILNRILCSAIVGALLIPVSQAVLANAENRLKDPGFELKLPPDQGGWILFDESRFSPHQAHSGSESMFNWGFSRTVPTSPFLLGTVSGAYQEFPAEPGSRWRLSGYGATADGIKGASAFGIVQVSFFDAAGNDLGTVETANADKPRAKTSNQVNSQTPAGEWVYLDTGIVTAPAATAKIHAFTLFVDYSGSGVSQGVHFDDLKLCALNGSDCQ